MVHVAVVVAAAVADDDGSDVVDKARSVVSVVDDAGFVAVVVDKSRSLVYAVVGVDFRLVVVVDDDDAISAAADPAVSCAYLAPTHNRSSSSCRCTRWPSAPVAAADVPPPPHAVAAAAGPDSAACWRRFDDQ